MELRIDLSHKLSNLLFAETILAGHECCYVLWVIRQDTFPHQILDASCRFSGGRGERGRGEKEEGGEREGEGRGEGGKEGEESEDGGEKGKRKEREGGGRIEGREERGRERREEVNGERD